jgi:hypothetical protein
MTVLREVHLDTELVERLAETLQDYAEENDNKVLNGTVVCALQYVTACVQRTAIPDQELN